jgi:phage gp36-like protein
MRSIHRIVSIAVAGASLVGLLGGCAKAPDQELAAAKSALQAAQTAEADKYLSDRYTSAMKALDAAQSEISKQNAAFILVRNYSQARHYLGIATTLATALQADAAGAKEAAKAEVEEGLTTAKTQAKEARDDLKKAPKSQGKAALEGMAAELAAADSLLVQAAAEIAQGNYLGARQKIGDAQAEMRKVSDKLSTGGGGGLMGSE